MVAGGEWHHRMLFRPLEAVDRACHLLDGSLKFLRPVFGILVLIGLPLTRESS
jgi:hypothetical protein